MSTQPTQARRAFLTARWEWLVMLNYEVPRELLEPLVPRGTELDLWQGRPLVSVVGFMFRNTRVLRVPVPLHRTFEEVNLRFYVKRREGEELRRGVTFVRELVPRAAIAAVARAAYNEPYLALPMRHELGGDPRRSEIAVAYEWRLGKVWSRVAVVTQGGPNPLIPGSEEEFITEHYWGYTRQRDGGTIEYGVEHPRWNVWQVREATLEGNIAELYGSDFGAALSRPPVSAFLADGSGITVRMPRRVA